MKTMRRPDDPKPGDSVILMEIPPGLLNGLPQQDQKAILAVLRKPVQLNEYTEFGEAELEFKDRHGETHFIYVRPDFLKSVKRRAGYR